MGFRFQKRIKLLPGITLNVSKSGLSTSLGTKGARVTYGHGQKRTTVGIPGTGLSQTNITSDKDAPPSPRASSGLGVFILAAAVVLIFILVLSR